MPVPKTLGSCADRLYKLREQKLQLNAKIKKLDEESAEIKSYLIDHLSKDNARGVLGKLAKVKINLKVVPTVEDWGKFYGYILKTKSWALLQRRCNSGAFRELWEDGKDVPGVEQFNVKEVSITKL